MKIQIQKLQCAKSIMQKTNEKYSVIKIETVTACHNVQWKMLQKWR